MKIALKTIDKIKAKGYKLTFYYGHPTKCFIKKDGGIFIDGRKIDFDSPTAALKYLERK